ncbi:MAG TPA: phenylalanine--tRNA ligase subunit beta [Campylobacterales bacterium]|nr:phenylalanine--tRNA ligase subunit beta [Campylobacterales bacterium]
MIVTKEWLKEWIDLGEISTDEICRSLNSIGLEVDSLDEIRVSKGIKVGFVKVCEKHPDADKLNVCQVDLGYEVTQIVCGAKNVAAGQFVAVATIGTILGKDFEIKEAKLRGVESNGMICSSAEIGLPKMNDGIMVLDESIGALNLGQELSEYPLVNDDVIDIELTANRGDCLSINGVARDLSASLNCSRTCPDFHFKGDRRGIARVLKFEVENDVQASVEYKFFEIKALELPFLHAFRLACVAHESSNKITDYLAYATHSTGVLLRAYDFMKFSSPQQSEVMLTLKKDKLGFDTLYCNDKALSVIGINQSDDLKAESDFVIVEASFIDPDLISQKKSESKVEVDDHFYRSSRGSEPNLRLGIEYLCGLAKERELSVYVGSHKHIIDTESKIVKIEHAFINNFIGQDIEAVKIIQILEHLGFGAKTIDSSFMVTIPPFRHDVNHQQDIIEELVRIIGIDNINSKALNFTESIQIKNDAYKVYKKRIHFRHKAVGVGFFEAIHYFFDNRELMQKYNLEVLDNSLDLKNPITNELNTLRSTLLLHLINSASRNMKFGKKSVKLFELGKVINAKREEANRLSFIFSGEVEAGSVSNHGKPETIDFFKFSQLVSKTVGEIELQTGSDENTLVSPYEYARVFIGGEDVGFIARVHVKIEQEFDLPRSYICELDFDKLKYEKINVAAYSKFPALTRDLSLIIPKTIKFSEIRAYLNELIPKEVIGFAPMDIYESEELGDSQSVTVKFEIQSCDKTLEEEQIITIMSDILDGLKEKFGIGIR